MSGLYIKHWVVTAWYPGGQGFNDEVVSKTEFTNEEEARAFMAEQKAENDSHHGWLCFRLSERFVPASRVAGLESYTAIPSLEAPDEKLSRAKRFFRYNPGCLKVCDGYSEYPSDRNGKVLCAKDVGYANDCPPGDLLDCRDCWNTKYGSAE